MIVACVFALSTVLVGGCAVGAIIFGIASRLEADDPLPTAMHPQM